MIFKNEKLTKFKKPRKPYTRRKTKLDDKIAEEAQAIVTKLNRVNESHKHSLEKRSEKLSLTEKIFLRFLVIGTQGRNFIPTPGWSMFWVGIKFLLPGWSMFLVGIKFLLPGWSMFWVGIKFLLPGWSI